MNAPIINAKLSLSIPDEQLESALYHSSVSSLSPEIRGKNKALSIFGSAIIEAAYSLYLYQNGIAEDYKDFSLLIDHAFSKTASAIYSYYELEQYVYCSAG